MLTRLLRSYPGIVFATVTIVATGWAFLTPGSIQLYVDPGIPPLRPELFAWSVSRLYLWTGQALGYPWPYPSELPYDLAVGFIALSGFPAQSIPILLIAIAMLLSGITMFSLSRFFLRSNLPATVAGLSYMLSPVLFNEVLASHLLYVVSYSIAPLAVYFFERSLRARVRWKKAALGSGLITAISAIQIQFVPMILLTLMARAAFFIDAKSQWRRVFAIFSIIGLVVVAINIYWIYAFLTGQGFDVSQPLISVYQMKKTSMPIYEAYRLDAYVTPFYQIGGRSILPFWDYFIIATSILPWIAIVWWKKSRLIPQFIFLASLGIFLLYLPHWASEDALLQIASIPGASAFREIYHLSFLVAFSYSMLIGFALYHLVHLRHAPSLDLHLCCATNREPQPHKGAKILIGSILRLMTVMLFLLLITGSSIAFLVPGFGHLVQNYDFSAFEPGYNYLQHDSEPYNVLFLPMESVVKFSADWTQWGRNLILLDSQKPSLDDNTPSGGLGYTLLVRNTVETSNDTSQWADLLSIGGIKYVVALHGIDSTSPVNISRVEGLLRSSQSFRAVYGTEGDEVSIFLNTLFQGMVYSPTTLVVSDNPSEYLIRNGTGSAIVDPRTLSTILPTQATQGGSLAVRLDSSADFLVRGFLPQDSWIDLSGKVDPFLNPRNGWTQFLSNWSASPGLARFLSNPVITESTSSLNFSLNFPQSGTYVASFTALATPLTAPPDSSVGFQFSDSLGTTYEWNSSNLPLNTPETIIERIREPKGLVSFGFKPLTAQEQIVIDDLSISSASAWENASREAQGLVSTVTDTNLSLESFVPQSLEINMSAFQLHNGPGAASSDSLHLSYCFDVNKTQSYNDISLSLTFGPPSNWSDFRQLAFTFLPEASGSYNLKLVVHSATEGNVFTQYLQAITIANRPILLSFDISKMAREEIDKIYFETSFDYKEYSNAESVCLSFGNMSLGGRRAMYVSQPSLSNNPITADFSNPTLIRVSQCRTLSNRLLVIAQDFDKAWSVNAQPLNNTLPIHMIVDGFLNGWMMPKIGSELCTVTYTRQSEYGRLIIFSFLAAITSTMTLFMPPGITRRVANSYRGVRALLNPIFRRVK